MEVIGEDGEIYETDDYVDGSVMGYAGPMGDVDGPPQVMDFDGYGNPVVVGRRHHRHHHRGGLVRVHKPNWRRTQLAPGVIAPDQGMLPLPLSGTAGDVFSATLNTITFQGQLQKPFRGERLLVSVVRTGTSATGRLISQLFVGTDLQQLDVPGFDAEQVGDPNAFGVRLTMKPAQPGVFIRLVTTLNVALTGTDTISASVTLLGRNVH